jgi:Aromatic acid exporter family member 1
MKSLIHSLKQHIVDRWFWIQQVVVTALAAAISWQVGDAALKNGGVVAAIVATLTVRSSLHKSTREGFGQIIGSSVGAGAALLSLHFFGLGIVTVGLTVLISLVAARILHLGEVAAINVPVTALIVIGPGLSQTNAVNRLTSTIIGASIAIVASIFAHPKTPAGRTIDRISSLTERCAVLNSQMAEGVAENYSQERAGRWLARARLLAEEIPSIRNQALEARVFAKWLPAVRSDNAERLYLRGVALEHIIIQTRSTARALFDIRLGGGMDSELAQEIATLLSTVGYALSVSAEDFTFDPYSATKEPVTAEIRMSAESATATAVKDAATLAKSQLARVMTVISSATIIAESLDQNSPTITKVPTPEGPASAHVLAKSPIDQAKIWQQRIYQLLPKKLRRYLEE